MFALTSLASGYKGQTFLLCKFYKIIPPLISEELLTCCESGWAPVKLHYVYTRTTKPVQTNYMMGKLPPSFLLLVHLVIV